jgi:hypothetical protein
VSDFPDIVGWADITFAFPVRILILSPWNEDFCVSETNQKKLNKKLHVLSS